MKQYSMEEVSLVINGRVISGFSDGDDVVSFDYNEEQFALTMGASGDSFRSKILDRSARLEFTLLQSADDNDFLEDLFMADQLTNTGVVSVRLTDLNTNRKYSMPLSWIYQGSGLTRGAGHNGRTWGFETDELTWGAN